MKLASLLFHLVLCIAAFVISPLNTFMGDTPYTHGTKTDSEFMKWHKACKEAKHYGYANLTQQQAWEKLHTLCTDHRIDEETSAEKTVRALVAAHPTLSDMFFEECIKNPTHVKADQCWFITHCLKYYPPEKLSALIKQKSDIKCLMGKLDSERERWIKEYDELKDKAFLSLHSKKIAEKLERMDERIALSATLHARLRKLIGEEREPKWTLHIIPFYP